MTERPLTPDQGAELVQVSRKTVMRAIEAGELEAGQSQLFMGISFCAATEAVRTAIDLRDASCSLQAVEPSQR